MPVYNHEAALPETLRSLDGLGLPLILVDDGSNEACARVIEAEAAARGAHGLRLPTNSGKGAAVKAGLRKASELGFSHALQVDADGQHDVAAAPELLRLAEAEPAALVSGMPSYDDSVPLGRLVGRYATHIWVWINTISLEIRDSMCGFRVYPVEPMVTMLDEVEIGDRMEFDTDIMVQAYRRGTVVRFLPVRVVYPETGVSHFRMLRDNLRISRMHALHFLQMLVGLVRGRPQ